MASVVILDEVSVDMDWPPEDFMFEKGILLGGIDDPEVDFSRIFGADRDLVCETCKTTEDVWVWWPPELSSNYHLCMTCARSSNMVS